MLEPLPVPRLRLPDKGSIRWTSFTKVMFRPEENWPAQICDLPLVTGHVGERSMALIADPDAARTVLAGSEEQFPRWRTYGQFASRAVGRQSMLATSGPQWRRQRRTFGPMFGPEQTNQFVALFHGATKRATAAWSARGVKEIDVFREMRRITLGNIWQVLLGSDASSELPAAVAAAADEIHAAQLGNDNRALAKHLTAIVDEARAGAAIPNLLAGDAAAASSTRCKSLMRQEIYDNARLLLAVGHESTALTLTWALWLLARDHEIQRQVHHEIDRVIGRGRIEAFQLPALEFTASALKETLRLFPALPTVARQSTAPIVLGGTSLPAKTVLVVCIYALQRHHRWWSEPEQFRPQRFAAGEPKHRYAYLPFSTGRHTCIGNVFGWTESLTILATILQQFRVDTTQEIRISPRAELLCPDRQVRVNLCDRNSIPSK